MSTFSEFAAGDWQSKYVDVNGIRTHYLESGSGDPLVLVHGGGSGADAVGNWKDCIPLLSDEFRVIAPDMVGYGKTDKPDPAKYVYSQENRNKHLLGFIDALRLERLDIVGNSMGGATSLGVTLAAPQRIKRLILMGSAGIRLPDQPQAPLKALVEYDFTVEGMRRLIAALTGPDYRPTEQMVTYRHAMSTQPNTNAALIAINEIVRKGGMVYPDEVIRQIKVPTLVMNGKLDQIATMSRAWRFLELIENSWGYIIPHAGHWIMIEAPVEFSAAVKAFLRLHRSA